MIKNTNIKEELINLHGKFIYQKYYIINNKKFIIEKYSFNNPKIFIAWRKTKFNLY
tara:strand:+ start:521 stop:688 length:168 start_codon:yes stop_codon:yes gene_type:complete